MDEKEERVSALIASVKKNYGLAETRLKNYEDLYGEGVIIPTINELRYAGNHFIKAITSDDIDHKLHELLKAERHCQRATYDACASAVSECFYKIQIFQERYSFHHKHVIAIIPDYSKYQALCRDVQEIVETVEFGNGQKEEHYHEIDTKLPAISQYVSTLYNDYIPQIDLLVSAEEKEKSSNNFKYYVATLIALVGTVVGVIALK